MEESRREWEERERDQKRVEEGKKWEESRREWERTKKIGKE